MILYSVFVFFLIASAFIANAILLKHMPVLLFVGLRMGISGVLLLIFCARDMDKIKTLKKYFFQLCTVALFTTFFPSLLRAFSLKNIYPSRAAFWGVFEPFIAALYMYILFKKKLSWRQIIGILIGIVAGVFFVVMNSGSNSGLTSIYYLTLPDITQISSLIISRYGWIKAQQLLQDHGFKPAHLNGLNFTMSGILALAISFFIGQCNSSSFLNDFSFMAAGVYTIIIGNMIAYTLYAKVLKSRGAVFVSLAGLSMPLSVHLISHFAFGEKLSWAFFVSLAIFFVALQLFYSEEKKVIQPASTNPDEIVTCEKK